jgi:hypothetical protein
MMDLIAQAAAPEAHVPLSAVKMFFAWITPFVVAILGAVGMRRARIKGREEGKASISTTIEGQVHTKEQFEPASRGELNELRREKNNEIDQLHSRMNSAFRILDRLGGTVDGIGDNVGRLLDIQLNLPPGTTAKRTRSKQNE